jgi:hypothetical protein
VTLSLPADATDVEVLSFAEIYGKNLPLAPADRERLKAAESARKIAIAGATDLLSPYGVIAGDIESLVRRKLRPTVRAAYSTDQQDLFEKRTDLAGGPRSLVKTE